MARPKKSARIRPVGSLVAIGYCRVSTTSQGDSGLGLDAQQSAIEAECQRRSWTLSKVAVDVASAASMKRRPQLDETLRALDTGAADVLVAASISRLARSLIDLTTLLERSRRHGWTLVVLDLGLDPSTPTGELTASILGAVSQHERRLISDRTSAALRAKRRQGFRLGRPVTLSHEVRQRIVRERAAGVTLTAIADGLTAEGIATSQGGQRWYPSTVKAVVESVHLDTK